MTFGVTEAGRDIPRECYAVVEIPMDSDPVKYEIDHETGVLWLDRFLATSFRYPCNYGYVPHTLADDGDALDVLVLSPYPIAIGAAVRCRPLGLLEMEDESGGDVKLLAVPIAKVLPAYRDWQDISHVPDDKLQAIRHFFSHYKELDPGKWSKVGQWRGVEVAHAALLQAVESAKAGR